MTSNTKAVLKGDCCGEMKSDTRFVYVPTVGDTVICDDCCR